jgi:GNAT superfamily N-acetyltransferase
MSPQIARLDELTPATLEHVRAIYEEAFPARQRVPFEEVVEDAGSGEELAFVGLEDGRPMGIAFLSRLESAGHLFLEYFAVASDLRGGGRGAALCQAIRAVLAEGEDGRPIVLEVEDPQEALIDAGEAAARERRVRFWQHAGAVMLPVEGYIVPNVGASGTEPLRLMWLAGASDDDEPRGARLSELILALYEAGYGLPADHELVQRARREWG